MTNTASKNSVSKRKEIKQMIEGKDLYLSIPEVQGFVDYLHALLSNEGGAEFRHMHVKDGWFCESIKNALIKYEWHGDFSKNEKALEKLSKELEIAVKNNVEKEVFRVCMKILEWGGVRNGVHGIATLYLDNNLITSIVGATNILTASSVDLTNFSKVKKDVDHEAEDIEAQEGDADNIHASLLRYRMNASFTKIYSLLSDQPFIIYDSRVAAAFGLIVKRYWQSKGFQTVLPESLSFAYPEGRGGNRNASEDQIKFKKVSCEREHAKWNVRANWIIERALANSHFTDSGDTLKQMRAVEAALFMIGKSV